MIGVLASPEERPFVMEFFELFKTPWELHRAGSPYDVVVVSAAAHEPAPEALDAPLVVLYGGGDQPERVDLKYAGRRLPVYGTSGVFPSTDPSIDDALDTLLTRLETGDCAGYVRRHGGKATVRIGYDLFDEVGYLLMEGQPAENAGVPTLDMHVALLRDLIVCAGIPLVEIPPVPGGHTFIACLTHDMDHPSIRRHRFDHTMFGFLQRATLGSAIDWLRGRLAWRKALTNWLAVARLPLVYLGLARDFWLDFDRYREIEGDRPSTFYVIPFARKAGRDPKGDGAPAKREAAYGVRDIAPRLRALAEQGCEVALHGIDAWSAGADAAIERDTVRSSCETECTGVRMHWLYMDGDSHAALEAGGLQYDSTVGYNETIGYRAGTSQAFRLIGAASLLELPMHVMDTALFYPGYLGLSQGEAWSRVSPLVDHLDRYGGVLTVNWHDRSIAPERLWDESYTGLIGELTARGAWFATADQAVSWFRKRRSAVFVETEDGVQARIEPTNGQSLPGVRLREYQNDGGWIDRALDTETNLEGPVIAARPLRASRDLTQTRN